MESLRPMTRMDLEAQAYAFREIVAHLQSVSSECSNIDIMNHAGMCRNCVAKWYHKGMVYAGGTDSSYEDALVAVYGEPYGTWKDTYQRKATPEQLEKFQATKHFHAKHAPVDTVKVLTPRQPSLSAKASSSGLPRIAVSSCPSDRPTICRRRSYWLDQNQGAAL